MLGINIDLTGHIFESEEDRRIYHNQVWYYKVYCQIIERGIEREKNEEINPESYYERHHILPKCMGGENEKTNLVKLTAREHILVHILLFKIYPKNFKLALSAAAMFVGNGIEFEERNKVLEKFYSIKTISSIRESSKKLLQESGIYKGENNPWAKKIKTLKENGEWKPELHMNFGKKWSDEVKKHMSEGRKGKYSGKDNKFSISVIGPDGTIYDSITQAVKVTGHSKHSIVTWINKKPERGWKYTNNYIKGKTTSVPIGSNNSASKKVIDPEGTVWESLTSAAEYYNTYRDRIYRWIKDPKTKWKYYNSEENN